MSVRTPRARRAEKTAPRTPGLTRARVCAAALEIVDAEGLDALSMRRLGARLGVEAMSLYRHVKDKGEVLDAVQAAVLADVDVQGADPTSWRSLLRGIASGLRAALLRHPKAIALIATRPQRTPDERVRWAWGALEAAGFSAADARRAVIVTGVYTMGHALVEANGEPAPQLGMPNQPGADEFAFGLEAMLDGIGARCLPRGKGERGAKHVKQRARGLRG